MIRLKAIIQSTAIFLLLFAILTSTATIVQAGASASHLAQNDGNPPTKPYFFISLWNRIRQWFSRIFFSRQKSPSPSSSMPSAPTSIAAEDLIVIRPNMTFTDLTNILDMDLFILLAGKNEWTKDRLMEGTRYADHDLDKHAFWFSTLQKDLQQHHLLKEIGYEAVFDYQNLNFAKLYQCLYVWPLRPYRSMYSQETLKNIGPNFHITFDVKLGKREWDSVGVGSSSGQYIGYFKIGKNTQVFIYVDRSDGTIKIGSNSYEKILSSHVALSEDEWMTVHIGVMGSYVFGKSTIPPVDSHNEGKMKRLPNGYSTIATRPFGDCQFSAMSDALFGTQTRHEEIRQKAVSYIKRHRSYYEPFMDSDDKFDDYIRRLKHSREYGDQRTLDAIGKLYNVRIKVYAKRDDKEYPYYLSTTGDLQTDHVVYLKLQNEHYEVLRPTMWSVNVLYTRPETQSEKLKRAIDYSRHRLTSARQTTYHHHHNHTYHPSKQPNALSQAMKIFEQDFPNKLVRKHGHGYRSLAWGTYDYRNEFSRNDESPWGDSPQLDELYVGSSVDYNGTWMANPDSFVLVRNVRLFKQKGKGELIPVVKDEDDRFYECVNAAV